MAKKFLESANILAGFNPIDLQDGANAGVAFSMENYRRALIVFFKDGGTAGDDPTLTVQQQSDVSNSLSDAKALNFTEIWKKQAADVTGEGTFTKTTQTAANTYTDLTSAEVEAIWVVEISADDLDDGFDCVKASVADVGGNAQLGCLFYILLDPRYSGESSTMPDPLSD